MLKELRFERRGEHGDFRTSIAFRRGLNTIAGGGAHTSALLLAVDACFGGEGLAHAACADGAGECSLRFAFSFGGTDYHFMRTVGRSDRLFTCDAEYRNPQEQGLDAFRAWLKAQYRLDGIDLPFRQIVGTYFRFCGGRHSPQSALRAYFMQSKEQQIRAFERLFEKYAPLQAAMERIRDYESRSELERLASKLHVEIAEFRKIDRKETAEKIAGLEARKKALLERPQSHARALDAENARTLAPLHARRQALSARRARLLTRIANIEKSGGTTARPPKAAYAALLEFFPNADIKRIEEIDAFHEKLCAVLAEEHTDALEDYRAELAEVQDEMARVETQISDLGGGEDYSVAFLRGFATVQGELERQESLLAEDLRRKAAAAQAKEDKRTLPEKEAAILGDIQTAVNEKLAALCRSVLGERAAPLRLEFPTNASYSLGPSPGGGAGADGMSLVLFDLSVLALTKLPALIHDAHLLRGIAEPQRARLMNAYASVADKQVFLASDGKEH